MKIGYQGDVGSNSEMAAKKIAEKLGFEDVEFVPLISSKNVIGALLSQEIDFGVVAIENSIGGIVVETKLALAGIDVEIVEKELLPIHHCLFKMTDEILNEEIQEIASHPQALLQTKEYRAHNFPNAKAKEIEDTAIGAMYLAKGELSPNVAVICSKSAGHMHNLSLIAENIEDRSDNKTMFHMLKMQ